MRLHLKRTLFYILTLSLYTPAVASELTIDELRLMSLEELLNVTIETDGKREEAKEDAAASVYVITQEDIQEGGHTTIAEALSMVPGIHMDRTWYLDRLVVRGNPSTDTKLLLMVDGQSMSMRGDNYNIYNGAAPVEIKDIERMEVILGPNSTLYGSGAFSGVVNIITKNARKGVDLSVNGSTVGEKGAYLAYGHKFEDMRLSISGGVQDSEGEKLDLTFPAGAPPSNTDINVVADGDNTVQSKRLAAKLDAEDFTLRAQYSDARIVWPDSTFGTDFNDPGSYYNIEHKSVQAKQTHKLLEETEATLRLYYIDSEGIWRGLYSGTPLLTPEGNELWHYGGKAYGVEYRANFMPSDDLSIILGTEFTDNFDVYSGDSSRSYTNLSLFTMMDYHLNDSLAFKAGARIEKYSFRNTTEFMPELATIYRPIASASLKLAYSRGFLAPSTWDLQIADLVGNTNLQPETVDNYEFIYTHDYQSWSHSLAFFYQEHSDAIIVSDTGFQATSVARNSAYSKIFQGVDWSADILFTERSLLKLGISYTDTEETDETTGETKTVAGSYDLLGYLDYRYIFKDGSIFTLLAKHVSEPNQYQPIQSWNRIDLIWLKKDFMGVDLRLKVGNLFDEKITTYHPVNQVENVPDHGRFFNFDLGIKF